MDLPYVLSNGKLWWLRMRRVSTAISELQSTLECTSRPWVESSGQPRREADGRDTDAEMGCFYARPQTLLLFLQGQIDGKEAQDQKNDDNVPERRVLPTALKTAMI